MAKTMGVGLLIVLAFVAGCNNCAKLSESLCKDLGADDCAAWKSLGGPDQLTPHGRGTNQACGVLMRDELAYEGLLLGAQGTVIADQLRKALDAKDYAKVEELKAKQEKIAASIQAGIAKRRNQ